VRHTPPGNGITVSVKEAAGGAEFSVIDEGEGIGAEHLPYIFQTFYTTRQGDTGQGIGLGLAICKTIIEAHGGSITARNRTDRTGAEVVFILPL
jgi:two-component system sensor histidine kinase KdpD